MHKTSLCLVFLFLISCSNRQTPAFKELKISNTQKEIQALVDSFKSDYSAAKTKTLQDIVVDKYNLKVFNFLSNNYLDSIHVHIDSVIIQDLMVTTKFHCNKDIAFQYGMLFKKEMNQHWDSLYNFMKGLRPDSDTTISFTYMGSHQLNNPLETKVPVLKIAAFPSSQFSVRQ